MTTGLTREDLTTEHQEKLTALLDRLKDSPTAEMIVRCAEAMGDSISEADRVRADTAMAAAWAYDRMLLYLVRLRTLNEERMEIGNQIRNLPRFPNPKSEHEADVEANSRVYAMHFAGQQEIVLNFIVVSIQHIHSLLKVVGEAVEYELDPDDEEFFQKVRPLRNHFEHWYSRLSGKTGEIGLVTKTVTDSGYCVTGGLERDNQDRIIVVVPTKPIVKAYIVEANNAGIARIEKIVRAASDKFEERVLQQVQDHFIANLNNIPSPNSVRGDLLLSVEGFGA